MSKIGSLYLPYFVVFWLAGLVPAFAADPSLSEAIKAANSKYLEAPESGAIDESPKIVAGGGEEGLRQSDEEISLGRLRVTLTYVEEEPMASDDVALPEGEEPADNGEPSVEDIPEEAMLPGEFDLGDTVPRAPVVTVYFDDPGPDAGQPSGQGDLEDPEATEAETAPSGGPTGPRVVAKLRGPNVGVSNPPVSVQIAELDPNNAYPEVILSFFSGGEHCCSMTHVVTSTADGSEWTTVDVGEFDGGPLLAVDLDGDGVFEFETRDNAFLDAFACYACSQAPLQVLALRDGKITDISADARFKPAHAAWLRNMIVSIPDQEVNGFLAGYVGQKIRLGEGKQAWELMLKYYDRNTDWGLELCDTARDETADCPGALTKVIFPEALERMLNENGYKIEG
jgi:hypothetical protein